VVLDIFTKKFARFQTVASRALGATPQRNL